MFPKLFSFLLLRIGVSAYMDNDKKSKLTSAWYGVVIVTVTMFFLKQSNICTLRRDLALPCACFNGCFSWGTVWRWRPCKNSSSTPRVRSCPPFLTTTMPGLCSRKKTLVHMGCSILPGKSTQKRDKVIVTFEDLSLAFHDLPAQGFGCRIS